MSAMTTFPILSPPAGGALIASSNSALREQVLHSLNGRCRPVQQALGGADALVKLEKGNCQVLFLDRRLPDLDAGELIAIIERRFPGTQVVLLDSDAAVAGEDFSREAGVELNPGRADARCEKSWQRVEGRHEPEPLPGMIGHSEVLRRVYRLAQTRGSAHDYGTRVGPTGTGKELVARAIHQLSARAAKPWAVVNCAAIPEALLESELFGHARRFTGAVQGYAGRIHLAQGGTLFLDEIGELPLSLQAKLLRFLDQKEVQRLGSSEA